MGETRAVAEFVAGLAYEDLPPSVVEQACRIVLDTMGCALAAWVEDLRTRRVWQPRSRRAIPFRPAHP